jgi:hypothetical protein
MRRLAWMLFVAGLFLAPRPAAAQNCPGGALCATIDCRPCNAGSFSAQCVCYPVLGHIICTVTNGDCKLGQCGHCQSTGDGQTCHTYARCPGMNCPTDHCGPSFAALDRDPCPDCVSQPVRNENANGPSVEVSNKLDFPIEVSAFDTSFGSESPGSFKIKNNAHSGLVTLILSVTLEAWNGETMTFHTSVDSWDRDAAFAEPGAEVEQPISLAADSKTGIRRATVKTLYAELADGTRLGPGARTLRTCMAKQRQATVQAYQDALAIYQRGGAKALRSAIQKNDDLTSLLLLDQKSGIDAVVLELSKERRLKP